MNYYKEHITKWKISLARTYLFNGKLKEARKVLRGYRDTIYFKEEYRKFYLIRFAPKIIVKILFNFN